MSLHPCILEYIWICVAVFLLNYHPKYLVIIFQATLSVEMATVVDAITGQMTAAESHDDCFQKLSPICLCKM